MLVKINTQMPVGQQIGNAIIGQERTQEPIGQQIGDAIIGKERTQEPIGQQIGDIIKGETPYETTITESIENTILSEKGMIHPDLISQHEANGFMPKGGKTITINGQTVQVQKVPCKKPGVFSFAPMYKEVVIIDGKEYDVQEVPDRFGCDKKKQVVVIDGKIYDVKNNDQINLPIIKFASNA